MPYAHILSRGLRAALRSIRPFGLAVALLPATLMPALAQNAPADPGMLSESNFIRDPGLNQELMGCACGWQIERVGTDGALQGAIRLNAVALGAPSAIQQELNGLGSGRIYELSLEWWSAGARLIVEVEGEAIETLIPERGGWGTSRVRFVTQRPGAVLRLSAESDSVGDDLVINWVSVVTADRPVAEGDTSDGAATEGSTDEATRHDSAIGVIVTNLPGELTADGVPIPQLPSAYAPEGTASAADVLRLPPEVNILAYSINDQVRTGPATPEDHYVSVSERGVLIEQGGGTNFTVVYLNPAQVAFRVGSGPFAGSYLTGGDNAFTLEPVLSVSASFSIEPPLEPTAGSFASFQSVEYPGQYIRHQGFVLKLDPASPDSESLLRRDATFRIVPSAQTAVQSAAPGATAADPQATFATCVGQLTGGGVLDWGAGSVWLESNAVNLCRGVGSQADIDSRFGCFTEQLAATGNWPAAITACTAR